MIMDPKHEEARAILKRTKEWTREAIRNRHISPEYRTFARAWIDLLRHRIRQINED